MLAVKEGALRPLPRKQSSNRKAAVTADSSTTLQTIISSNPQSFIYAHASDLQNGIPRSQLLPQANPTQDLYGVDSLRCRT
ncbi:hypothetical protein COCCADRAFT_96435 [Bipolaris zeicola 26-R-13]|uniref:Uncharacterized protein n=1 Tax=Cochliobolus carbonum (strain 26-R-13) TaxID=930089 RepID=W6Y0S0_COCC2|nr:uncharacterized protein COCCADRAFT_96435 [Bipolaris zeicola 26-R-13]EUC33322.1 hypothetical protein COCCADRAFT_96435 [Bipolaris zeicola 26-R-13]